MSDIRYICIKRSSLHWRYGAALATWHQVVANAYTCTLFISTMPQWKSSPQHLYAVIIQKDPCHCLFRDTYMNIYIYNNGDRQIGFGEKRKCLAKPDLSHHRKGFHLFKFVNIECMPDLTHWLGPNGNRQCRLAKFWQMVSQQTLHQTPLR